MRKIYPKQDRAYPEIVKPINMKNYCPWELAYQLCKNHYTKEEIDEMSFCEIKEIILDQDENI